MKPGARVRLASGSLGEFMELRGDGKAVVRVGSLKLVVDPGSLTEVRGDRRSAAPPVRPSASSTSSAAPSYDIDLRGMTGDEAEQAVVAALDRAVLAEQPYLRIIHGKGTGVVRDRVRRVLQDDRRVKSHGFAPPTQGGTGVTVAEFAP